MYDRRDQRVITHLPQNEGKSNPSVILTFDDGPGRVLPGILDVLKQENVPAMFFWQTRLLYAKRPWQRVMSEGHMIGSHSCKHPDLSNMTFAEQYKELAHSKHKIEEITGRQVTYFRPPFGQYNDDTIQATKELDMTPVLWRIGSFDWELKDDPKRIVSNVIDNLEDGAIVLLHELPQTLAVLSMLIKEIKHQGYDFAQLKNR